MSRAIRNILGVLSAAFLIFTLTGCAELHNFFTNYKLDNEYAHPDFRRFKLHDIGLVPLKNDTEIKKDIITGATKQLVRELNKRGWYVVHMIKQEDLNSPEKLPTIDAVLVGSIIDYRDVEPLKFGIKLVLMDINTKETIWSAQEIFDASNPQMLNNIKNYYSYKDSKTTPIIGYKLYIVSINKFMEYAYSRMVDTLDAEIKDKIIADNKEVEELKQAKEKEETRLKSEERRERIRQKEKKSLQDKSAVESATLIIGG
jgi:hypothetical protein